MMSILKKLTFIFVGCYAMIGFAQNEALFEQGKEKYAAQQYQQAIDAWSQILQNGKHDATLYFNLGNAHYKMNNIGPSVYYYEKALQLDPTDRDIKNNLVFAQNARVDAIEPLPKTIFSKWYHSVANILTFDGWAWTVVVCSFLFVGLFLLYYFSISEGKKRLFFVGSIVTLLVFIGTMFFAFRTYSDIQKDRPAIIFAESTEVRSAPNMGGEKAFVLHEGTKVQITAEENKWVRILLADGKDGWMPKSELKAL